MTYEELIHEAVPVAKTGDIEVVSKDGTAYKIFSGRFSKREIFYEAMLHAAAESAGLNVPKIYEIINLGEKTAVCTEYIRGKTFAELMSENPEKTDAYLRRMVELQLNIHAVTAVDIKKLKHKLKRDIDSISEIDYIKKYELMMRLESMPEHSKLCHGNFTPENIIVSDENGKEYIVDWVRSSRGNASADIAGTYLKLALHSTENAEKYIRCFSEMTGTAKNYVQEWIPIMAASLLAEDVKGEREKALAFAWLDVFDYQ